MGDSLFLGQVLEFFDVLDEQVGIDGVEQVVFLLDFDVGIALHTGAAREQLTDDDVLLEAEQRVGLALDGRVGEDTGRLLEGGGGQEGVGGERSLGDTEEHRVGLGVCRFATGLGSFFLQLLVDSVEVGLLDDGTRDEVGLTGIGDGDLLHHLTDDDFDVLVVDVNTLHPVDALDFTDEVIVDRIDAHDFEKVMRVDGTFGQGLALLDGGTGHDLLAQTQAVRDEVGLLLPFFRIGHDDMLALLVVVDGDSTVELGQDGEGLRSAGYRVHRWTEQR